MRSLLEVPTREGTQFIPYAAIVRFEAHEDPPAPAYPRSIRSRIYLLGGDIVLTFEIDRNG